MAMICQAGTETREFAWEFEWCTRDASMAEEDAKVHLVLVLNQDTLSHLDAYITVRVAMAVWCVAQQATLHSIAQHTWALQHNATTGITHTPSIVSAEIGRQFCTTWYNLSRNSIKV